RGRGALVADGGECLGQSFVVGQRVCGAVGFRDDEHGGSGRTSRERIGRVSDHGKRHASILGIRCALPPTRRCESSLCVFALSVSNTAPAAVTTRSIEVCRTPQTCTSRSPAHRTCRRACPWSFCSPASPMQEARSRG